MGVRYLERINPEAECILLLERRFQPDPESPRSIDEIRSYLSEKYDIPLFELDPLLQPLLEVESYVNSNLSVSEDRLRFFFTMRSKGPASLAWPLYQVLKSGVHFGTLDEPERLRALAAPLARIMDIDVENMAGIESQQQLMQYLLQSSCSEDVKWICTALYYSIDDYLEELDVILRKATGLFLEHLPDLGSTCRKAIAFAREQIGEDPSGIFHNLKIASQPEQVTVVPCLMGFHGLRWDFQDARLDFGVYYSQIGALIQKYSDQSTNLVGKLKSMGDKSRLEILKALKNKECNGQDIAEKLGLTPATISHHINLLANEGFVTATKRGASIYYNLSTEALRRFLQELEHCLL